MAFWKRRRQKSEVPPSLLQPESPSPPAPSVVPPPAKRVGMSFGVRSDVGRVRPTNQDHVFALQISLPGPNGQETLGFFIVADGMGGHVGGATASARAVEIVTGQVLQGLVMPVLRGEPPAAIQDLLREAVLLANRRILDEAALQHSDMGTTLTAALLLGGRCYLAHVGDSRLYTYGQGQLQQRTRDHSMVARLLELGQISPAEANNHPKRNYLYQSVGQQEEIEVESDSFTLDNCSHVLLCSDGLWGIVAAAEENPVRSQGHLGTEEQVLIRALSGGQDPQEICDHLVAQANEAGGEDNISVIVVALPQG